MATKFEKQMASLTPAQRKKANELLGNMMGVAPKKKRKTTKSKRTK